MKEKLKKMKEEILSEEAKENEKEDDGKPKEPKKSKKSKAAADQKNTEPK